MAKKTKKNYYAVVKGGMTVIFENYEECRKSVNGYSGALFKGFEKLEDAENFLNQHTKKDLLKGHKVLDIYVDGSYDDALKKYSCGIVILTDSKQIEISKSFSNPLFLKHRNVAGEILGVLHVFDWIYKNSENYGYDYYCIHYDYEGIKNWALGSWKAKKILTQIYQEVCKDVLANYNIIFNKVIAHSGDFYNDLVDKIAKTALEEESSEIVFEFFDFEQEINMHSCDKNKFTKYLLETNKVTSIKHILINEANKNNLCIMENEVSEEYINYRLYISHKKYMDKKITITQYRNKRGNNCLTIQGYNYYFYDIICEKLEEELNIDYKIIAARISTSENEEEFNRVINILSDDADDIPTNLRKKFNDCIKIFNKIQLTKLKSVYALFNKNLDLDDYSSAIQALCKSAESLMKNIIVKYNWEKTSVVDSHKWKWYNFFNIPKNRYDSFRLLEPYNSYEYADLLEKPLVDIYKNVCIKYRNPNSHGKVEESIINYPTATKIFHDIVKYMNNLGKVCTEIDNNNI